MRKSWLMCALLAALAWGQTAPVPAAPAQPAQDADKPAGPAAAVQSAAKPAAPAAAADASAAVPPEAAVITVNGVCSEAPKPAAPKAAAAKPAPAAKTPPADCKTVITKAEFERLASAVAPTVTPQLKRQLAGVLPRFIAMSSQARKKGLDKTPQFKELVKFAQMQILANELQRNIQEEAAKVPAEKIAAYYKDNPEAFAQYNVERLFVPRTKQIAKNPSETEDKDKKLSEEEEKAKQAEDKAKQEEAEQAMSKLAEDLRSRAAAGEDFIKLQKEAFEAAGMKIESPTVSLPKMRRTGLPPAHASVFDLKPGDVSPVINDAGGHYIYKLNSEEQLSLDQVKDEIHNTLQNQRMRDMMEKVNNSYKVETNEAYFGPGSMTPALPPGRGPAGGRIPSPQRPPGSVAPAQPQAPPQAQPAAQPPAAKPN